MVDFSRNTLCLITGASRGIGRSIAVEFARKSTNHLTLILISRSESGLLETKSLVEAANSKVSVQIIPLDLSVATVENFEKIIQGAFSSGAKFESAVIFHNAGFIGDIKKSVEISPDAWQEYYKLNLFSVTALNSVFINRVKGKVDKIIVVHITSLVGRKPFKYLSLYGSAKSARDMYFKVFALEEPEVTVLNYSPGMVETAMADELVENIRGFEDSEIAVSVRENPAKLKPEQTVRKMFSILEKAEFQSGDIIDYYD